MRASLLLSVSVLVTLAPGCKGKPPTDQVPDPKKVEKPGSGSATPPVENAWTPAQQKDIVLPDRTGSAPLKTTAPITAAKLATLSELTFPEWDHETQPPGPQIRVRFTTKSRPFIMATVVVSACDGTKNCPPMDLAQWKLPENAALLHYAFNKDMQALKGAVTDVGSLDFFGQKMIFEYHLGEATRQDENQNTGATYGHAYTLFWNDGVNQIHVTAEYRDLAPVSQEALGQIVPRANFEQIARAFMDYYTHAWL